MPARPDLTAIERELAWLKTSGIQAPPGHADAGGVFAWIDEDTGAPSFVYSEITGYFLTLCAHLARYDESGGWLARAEAAATWLEDVALTDGGAILARKYADPEVAAGDPYSMKNQRVLFFDTAMVGCGLVALHDATGEARWLRVAERVAAFCERAHESSDQQTRWAAYDLPGEAPAPATTRWSGYFGPFELKGALFFEALATASGDPRPMAFVERLVANALAGRQPEGRFATTPDGATTHLHPHFYTVEGLLHLVARRGRRELLGPALDGIDWAFRTCLLPADKVQQWSTAPEQVIAGLRSDVVAQALRAFHVAKLLAPEHRFGWEDRVGEVEAVLEHFRLTGGGTSYGADEYGAKARHANAWCHFFATEMRLFAALRAAGVDVDPARLILT